MNDDCDEYKLITSAVSNDTVVGQYMISLSGSSFIYNLPGVSRVSSYNVNARVLNFFISVLYYIWPYVLMPAIVLLFFIKFVFLIFKFKRLDLNLSTGSIAFASGYTTLNVIKKVVGDDCFVLHRPGKKFSDEEERHFDCLEFLSVMDVLYVAYLSIVYTFTFSRDNRFSGLRFYSIHFFELLLVVKAFENIGYIEKLYTGDHFNRWAVLLDLISSDKNKVGFFSVVQHGGLKNFEGCFPLDLPVRLSSVDCLYCFDVDSYSIFKESIIDKCKEFSVSYFKNAIFLSDVPSFDGVVILIVGNSLCYDFHVSIFKSIFSSSDKSLKVFYKPHPTQIMSHYESEGWEVIMEPKFFPKVDLVISYPSTLVDQYKEHGIPVLTHDISERFNIDCRVFHDVRSFLDSQK